tara:strand:+ start:478 stop:1299 length:822 start_codon:yes stop_codon:yes gene_type:complete
MSLSKKIQKHKISGSLKKIKTPRHMITCKKSENGEEDCSLKKTEQLRWLNNIDIENLINEIIMEYKKYTPESKKKIIYMGHFPMDWYECAQCNSRYHAHDNCKQLYNLNINHYDEYDSLFFIFNLDKHTGPGTHWVALHLNPKQRCAHYYDSIGRHPPNNIITLLKHFNSKLTNPFEELLHSAAQHQEKGGECGVFCISFITHLLLSEFSDNNNYKEFVNQQLFHNDMMYLRSKLYGPIWLEQYEKENGHRNIPQTLKNSAIWKLLTSLEVNP